MQCILFFCCTQRITLPYICIFYHTKNSLVYIRVERFSCGKSIQIGHRLSRQQIYQSNKKKIAVYRGWKQFVVTLHHVMLYTSALKMYAHFLQEMHGIIQFQNRLYQFVCVILDLVSDSRLSWRFLICVSEIVFSTLFCDSLYIRTLSKLLFQLDQQNCLQVKMKNLRKQIVTT